MHFNSLRYFGTCFEDTFIEFIYIRITHSRDFVFAKLIGNAHVCYISHFLKGQSLENTEPEVWQSRPCFHELKMPIQYFVILLINLPPAPRLAVGCT